MPNQTGGLDVNKHVWAGNIPNISEIRRLKSQNWPTDIRLNDVIPKYLIDKVITSVVKLITLHV